MRRPVPLLLAPLLCGVLLAGCTADGPDLPDESAFAEGTCRTAAPDVRAVGAALPELEGDSVSEDVRADLREAQDRLFALAEAAEPAYKPALDALVVQIGAVRIRADGNTYEPELGERLGEAYDAAVQACT